METDMQDGSLRPSRHLPALSIHSVLMENSGRFNSLHVCFISTASSLSVQSNEDVVANG